MKHLRQLLNKKLPAQIAAAFALVLVTCLSRLSAEEQKGSSFLDDIAKTCSGYIEIHGKGTGGSIKFQNYDLTIDAGNTLDVTYNGVLLRKVQNFDAKDYLQCVHDLAPVMKDLQQPSK
jgi:hypothetical protein